MVHISNDGAVVYGVSFDIIYLFLMNSPCDDNKVDQCQRYSKKKELDVVHYIIITTVESFC